MPSRFRVSIFGRSVTHDVYETVSIFADKSHASRKRRQRRSDLIDCDSVLVNRQGFVLLNSRRTRTISSDFLSINA